MGITIQVEKDGLALRNVSGTEPGNEESTGTILRADCDDFRKFLGDAKSGKYDNLV